MITAFSEAATMRQRINEAEEAKEEAEEERDSANEEKEDLESTIEDLKEQLNKLREMPKEKESAAQEVCKQLDKLLPIMDDSKRGGSVEHVIRVEWELSRALNKWRATK